MTKLFNLVYLVAKKGCPFSDFADFVELEKAYSEVYGGLFKQCTEFVKYINKSLFEYEIKSKVKRCNVVTVLCNGSTDSTVVEKECIYIIFVDPETFVPQQ